MWLYYLLKSMSWIISHLPYKLVVKIGLGLGRLYYIIAKKQRIRAEETIKERLGYSDKEAKKSQPVRQAGRNLYGNYVHAGFK